MKENNDHEKKITKTIINKRNKHFITSILSTSLVWLIATIVYVSLLICKVDGNIWLTFIYSIPISAIVLIVFSSLWGTNLLRFLCVSLLLWGVIISVTLSTPIENIWYVCEIGAVGQFMIILWFSLVHLAIKRKNKQ